MPDKKEKQEYSEFIDTNLDYFREAKRKQREEEYNQKVQEVARQRKNGLSVKKLADMYNVTSSTIYSYLRKAKQL